MVRHDWISLKNQFVIGNWLTVSNFFRDNKIKDNSRNRINTKGWIVERKEYQGEVFRRAREQNTEEEVNIRLRQQKLAQKLQDKGMKKLQELPVKKIEEARKLLVSGLQEEREALGINRKSEANLTQADIRFPKTRFDKFLEGQDFEGILTLLIEVRKERLRRSERTV